MKVMRVLFACALEKDFEMLPDDELTDIGASGINLSGGQKWRISFARALYSRARILIMDDIFSALDAHTGRHLHIHALTGELSEERDKNSFHLENDAIKYAGTLVELRRTGTLSEILVEEDTKEEAKKSSPSPAFHKQSAEGDSANAQTGVQGQTKEPPRKFQQEEGREIGVVKLINYVKYLQNGGELPL
ncbi:hypothetical protein H106_01999 [Trichophyton rubrum CBS 735.88]|nr:hypothetical protein H106_01999 [Trichophyton rubrum CBS 735.88]